MKNGAFIDALQRHLDAASALGAKTAERGVDDGEEANEALVDEARALAERFVSELGGGAEKVWPRDLAKEVVRKRAAGETIGPPNRAFWPPTDMSRKAPLGKPQRDHEIAKRRGR